MHGFNIFTSLNTYNYLVLTYDLSFALNQDLLFLTFKIFLKFGDLSPTY